MYSTQINYSCELSVSCKRVVLVILDCINIFRVCQKFSFQKICRECFYEVFEEEIHQVIVENQLFKPGERIAIGASGGKGESLDNLLVFIAVNSLNCEHM